MSAYRARRRADTYIGPANHVSGCPIEIHERVVLEYKVRKVDAEDEFKKAEAQADRAILPSERLEGHHVQHFAPLAEFRLDRHRLDVGLAVDEETLEACRASILQETRTKSAR